jgi:GcrA cell cycle regulator
MADTSVTWTDERLELLKKLWSEGLSASQIAAEIGGGMTRNAVLGKSHRLGLVRNTSSGTSAPRSRKESPAPGKIPTPRPSVRHGLTPMISTASQPPNEQAGTASLPEEITSPPQEGLTIMDLREGMCRWPLGDPTRPEFRYCGAHAIAGLPYCSHHAQIAYLPTAERKRLRA